MKLRRQLFGWYQFKDLTSHDNFGIFLLKRLNFANFATSIQFILSIALSPFRMVTDRSTRFLSLSVIYRKPQIEKLQTCSLLSKHSLNDCFRSMNSPTFVSTVSLPSMQRRGGKWLLPKNENQIWFNLTASASVEWHSANCSCSNQQQLLTWEAEWLFCFTDTWLSADTRCNFIFCSFSSTTLGVGELNAAERGQVTAARKRKPGSYRDGKRPVFKIRLF